MGYVRKFVTSPSEASYCIYAFANLMQVVGAIVDLMDSVEVNSPEGALTLSRTMSSCMDSGGMSLEKKVNQPINK